MDSVVNDHQTLKFRGPLSIRLTMITTITVKRIAVFSRHKNIQIYFDLSEKMPCTLQPTLAHYVLS